MGFRSAFFASCLFILLRPAAPMQVQWHEPLLKAAKITPNEMASLAQRADTAAREALMTKKAIWLNTGCETCAGKDYSQLCPAGWQGWGVQGSGRIYRLLQTSANVPF